MNLDNVLSDLKKFNKKDLIRTIVEVYEENSSDFYQFDYLARCCFESNLYEDSIRLTKKAIDFSNNLNELMVCRSNLINLYNKVNLPQESLDLIEVNEHLMSDDFDLQSQKAFSLYMLNRKEEASLIIREALKRTDLTEEQTSKLIFNLGTYELLKDNFLYGLECFLIEGKRIGLWQHPLPPGEQWIGQPVEGRKIFVIAEAGIGDEIINVRFMKHLVERGAEPVFFTTRTDLFNVFKKCGFSVTNSYDDYKPGMLWIMSMQLPLFLKCDYGNLWYGPYIKSDPEIAKKYSFIKQQKGKKIGIRWQGFAGYEQDLNRTVPLNELMNILPTNNSYFSLQKEEGLEKLINFPNIIDTSNYLTDYEETLGIIENLDYVITSCTSVAHASAAMGKKTLILVPIASYYVWCHTTKQSPWYGDNVVLFRQQVPNSWKEPLEELKNYLIFNNLV